MAGTATLRDLRNRFPKVRKMVECEGEVLLTERGKTRYRLTLYTPATTAKPAGIALSARRLRYTSIRFRVYGITFST